VAATFCFENCANGPTVTVNGQRIGCCHEKQAIEAVQKELKAREAKS